MLQINSVAPNYCDPNNLTDSFLLVDAPLSVDLRTRDCSSKLNITYYYTGNSAISTFTVQWTTDLYS